MPGEAFGLARSTLALSSQAPAASVLRAWSPGSVAQSLQKRGVRATDRPSFCGSEGHSQWPAWDAVPAAAPRGRSKAPGEAFAPKQATSF